jgi:hypothetical protein
MIEKAQPLLSGLMKDTLEAQDITPADKSYNKIGQKPCPYTWIFATL